MKVPFVDLKTQYLKIKPEIDAAIQDVIEQSAFISGKHVLQFESDFARYISAGHCISVGNGTDALFIALKVLGLKEGDEVITAANSFIATSEAITMTGAKPVFVDCDRTTYTIDVTKISKAITARTRAIVPVHLYGQPADMQKIMAIAKKHNLAVIEDAAQAHGARDNGAAIGTIGEFGCFSFFPGKNLGAYGDAGAIVTNNADLARKARMFANHGRIEKYNHEFEGMNSRLDGMQAAVLSVKLKYLEQWTERRRTIAKRYDEELRNVVTTPSVRADTRHVYHLYVVRVQERDRLIAKLKEKNISTGIHYPIPLPFLKAYAYLGHNAADFPVAHACKDQILSLPIHGDMTDDQVAYVIDEIKSASQ